MQNLEGGTLNLDRYPPKQKNRSLQAWDAADEYILEHWLDADLPQQKLLIINDAFGALACSFAHGLPTCTNDSYISQLGIKHNFKANGLPEESVTLIDSLVDWPTDIAAVMMKLPKNHTMLEHLLNRLAQLPAGIPVVIGGKAKDISKSMMLMVEKYLDDVTSSLAKKKARLIFASAPQNKPKPNSMEKVWPLDNSEYLIHNMANVYSRNSLDLGARLLLQHLPQQQRGKMIDLGCGNGVIGLNLLAQNPDAEVMFVDESHMAVASAAKNVAHNLNESLSRASFVVDDCLSGADKKQADWVICNPPFHQQQAVTDHIAWQMFNDAFKALKSGGKVRIIGNRHLAYQAKLKKIFGNVSQVASNNKFVIFDAEKR